MTGQKETVEDKANTAVNEALANGESLNITVTVDQLAHFSVVTTADQAGQKYGPSDSLEVSVVSGSKNVDLSGLVVTDGVFFDLTGNYDGDGNLLPEAQRKAVTFIGSSGNDVIEGGQFDGDTLTGGGGARRPRYSYAGQSGCRSDSVKLDATALLPPQQGQTSQAAKGQQPSNQQHQRPPAATMQNPHPRHPRCRGFSLPPL